MIQRKFLFGRTFGLAFVLVAASVGGSVLGGDADGRSGRGPSAAARMGRAVERTSYRQAEPSLEGGVGWINTAAPIHLEDLRGKIVLLDFWTYCCINCHHVLPDLARLEAKYPNELVVIGVHTAKFDAERVTENIRKKVREYRIEHPVVNDADMVIWRRFGVNSWPTLAVIDATGKLIGGVSGEGHYELLDRVIGQLAEQHRQKNELNETPLRFLPEKDRPHDSPLLFPGKVLADAASDRLFISDTGHNRIVVTDLAGRAVDVIGNGETGFTSGSYDRATFNRPQGMCLVDGILYVADTENHAIRAVDLAAKQVKTVAGIGEQSQARKAKGPGTETGMNSPWDLILIPGTRKLAIAMAGPHQIWTYDLESRLLESWAGSGIENIIDGTLQNAAFAQPSGFATDGESIFVADSEVSGIRTIQVKPPHQVGRVVGKGLFDYGDKDGVGEEVLLQHCLGLAYADGTLYIADTYNNKVKVCDPKTKSVKSFVGSVEPGESDDPPRFDEPGGLSIAGDALYVADTNNHAVRKVDRKTGKVATLELTGLSAPVSRPRPPSFPNAVAATLPATEVAPAASIALDVKLSIPDGFKLSPDFPLVYLVEAPDQAGLLSTEVSPTGTEVSPPTAELGIQVPLAKTPEPGTKLELKVSVASVVCREGAAGVCIPKSAIWTVPVVFKEQGAQRVELRLPEAR